MLIFSFTFLFSMIVLLSIKPQIFVGEDGDYFWYRRGSFFRVFISLLPLLYFVGYRTSIADTVHYISSYIDLPSNFSVPSFNSSSFLFDLVERLSKSFISPNPTVWLFIVALLGLIPFCITTARYSQNVQITIFLFFSSCEFCYLLNGARQFIAISIGFYALNYLEKKQFVKYIICILVAASFHATALILIPAIFIANSKPWSYRVWGIIIAVLIGCVFSQSVFESIIEPLIADSYYSHYADAVYSSSGVNIFRILVWWVPVILTFVYRREIEAIHDNAANICVNYSLMNALIYTYAGTMGGFLIGRLSEYFTIYTFLLYPFLFQSVIKNANRRTIYTLFVIAFLTFYFYQIMIVYNGLDYVSTILGIY